MIDRGDNWVRQSTVAAHLASLPGAGYGQFEHKADSPIAKSKKRRMAEETMVKERRADDFPRPATGNRRLAAAGCAISRDVLR